MFYRTQKMTMPYALTAALVECWAARPAAALLLTPTLRLYVNPALTINPATLLTAFTEATFSGYTAATIAAWIGPVALPGIGAAIHAEGDFAADAGIGAGATCYGYYLTDAGNTVWYAAEQFIVPGTTTPAPMNFSNPGDFASIDAVLAAQNVLGLGL